MLLEKIKFEVMKRFFSTGLSSTAIRAGIIGMGICLLLLIGIVLFTNTSLVLLGQGMLLSIIPPALLGVLLIAIFYSDGVFSAAEKETFAFYVTATFFFIFFIYLIVMLFGGMEKMERMLFVIDAFFLIAIALVLLIQHLPRFWANPRGSKTLKWVLILIFLGLLTAFLSNFHSGGRTVVINNDNDPKPTKEKRIPAPTVTGEGRKESGMKKPDYSGARNEPDLVLSEYPGTTPVRGSVPK